MLTCLLGVNPIVFSFFLNNEVLTSASASSYDKRWMGEEVAIKFLKMFTILCKKKVNLVVSIIARCSHIPVAYQQLCCHPEKNLQIQI